MFEYTCSHFNFIPPQHLLTVQQYSWLTVHQYTIYTSHCHALNAWPLSHTYSIFGITILYSLTSKDIVSHKVWCNWNCCGQLTQLKHSFSFIFV